MQDDKMFKIKQIILNNGETIFKVFGCKNKYYRFFKGWIEYSKDNKTFEDALSQIELLSSLIPKETRTVYSTRYVFSDNKKFEKAHK